LPHELAGYWSCGAGPAKRRSIRFALIPACRQAGFLLLFLSRKKEEEKRTYSQMAVKKLQPVFYHKK